MQSLATGARTIVVNGGKDARYLSTGHIVYTVRDACSGPRSIRPPDGDHRSEAARPRRAAAGGVCSPSRRNYAVSNDGTLVYVTGSASQRSLVGRATAPAAEPIANPAGRYEDLRLSPDDSRLLPTHEGDIWINNIGSGRSSRVTRDGASLMGVWHPTAARWRIRPRPAATWRWVTSADGGGQPRR